MNRVRGPLSHKRMIAALLAVGVLAAGLGAARLALATGQLYPIDRAASIYLTQRGQKYFAKRELVKILERNHIDLTHGTLKEWRYDAPENFKLRRLPKDVRDRLSEVRTALDEWLGFELNTPRFHAVVREAGYEIGGLELGVRIDRELTEERGAEGVVILAELTIPQLRAQAQSLCGFDSNNPIFGDCKQSLKHPNRHVNGFGVYNPWVELRGSEPLRLSIPVHIRIGPSGTLQFDVFKRDSLALSNLKRLDIATGQDRELLIPNVTIRIGSQKLKPNPSELRKVLTSKQRELVRIGLHHLHNFIEEELPARLNGMLLDQLSKSFETVKEITPPGTALFGITTPLKWGMRPSALGLADDLLYFHLDGHVSDPTTGGRLAPTAQKHRLPDLRGMARSDFDFAVALNLDVVNQIIEHSYLRGNLSAPTRSGSLTYRVASLPVLKGRKDRKGRIHASLEMERDGSFRQWLALSNPFQIEVDVDVRIEPATLTSFNLVIDQVDRHSSFVPDRFIDHAKGSVGSTVRDRLDGVNADFERTTTYLTDQPIELPKDMLGLPLRLLRGDFDQAGYLNLYFAYGDRS